MNVATQPLNPETPQEPSPADPRQVALIEVFGEDFAGRFRDPVVFLRATYSAPPSKSFYRRDFHFLSRNLWLEEVYRRRAHFNETILDDFARMVGAKLVTFSRFLDTRMDQTTKLLAAQHHQWEPVYLQQQDYLVPVIAPAARSFIELLRKFDDYYQMLGYSNLMGVLDGSQRRKAELEARKAVRSFTAMVGSEVNKLRRESLRLRTTVGSTEGDSDVVAAEAAADAATAALASSDDDPATHVPPEQAGQVLDDLAATTAAAAAKRTRKAAAPAAETAPITS